MGSFGGLLDFKITFQERLKGLCYSDSPVIIWEDCKVSDPMLQQSTHEDCGKNQIGYWLAHICFSTAFLLGEMCPFGPVWLK